MIVNEHLHTHMQLVAATYRVSLSLQSRALVDLQRHVCVVVKQSATAAEQQRMVEHPPLAAMGTKRRLRESQSQTLQSCWAWAGRAFGESGWWLLVWHGRLYVSWCEP